MEYLFHKWPRITIQSFYHRVCNKSNMTCVISDAGTMTLPEYLSSLLVFSELGNKSNMTCVISDHVMLLLLPNSLKARSELKYSGRVTVPASLMTHVMLLLLPNSLYTKLLNQWFTVVNLKSSF
jgi:hypothetical protein